MPGMRRSQESPVRRGFAFNDFKALGDDSGTFEGYLAVTGNVDYGSDVLETGCMDKTLAEMRARREQRAGLPSGRYLLPIFWAHDDKDPIGGVVDAHIDAHGLWVKGELDLDTEQGKRARSGLARGYIPGLSIGYFPVNYKYDRANVRHLTEISIFECTVTSIPMNPEALVLEVKSATGKADWPLGDRDAAWDAGAAHKRIVAWATGDDGTVDVAKLKSVHFWSPTGDDAQDVSKYKLGYCDVTDGGAKVEAMPRGIFACAGAHGVDAADLPSGDVDAVKAKIAAYYVRMAKAFDDESIKVPWADAQASSGGKGKSMRMTAPRVRPAGLPQGKASDYATALQGAMQGDTLQREWAKSFDVFVHTVWEGMIDAVYPLLGSGEDEAAPSPEDALDATVDAFADQVKDLIKRSIAAGLVPHLDDDADSFEDPDEDDEESAGYMSRMLAGSEGKAGRIMSSANHKEMGGLLAAMKKSLADVQAQHKSLQAFHAKMDPSANKKPDAAASNDGSDTTSAAGDGKALTNQGAGAHGEPTSDTTPLTSEEFQHLIRMNMATYAAVQTMRSQSGAQARAGGAPQE